MHGLPVSKAYFGRSLNFNPCSICKKMRGFYRDHKICRARLLKLSDLSPPGKRSPTRSLASVVYSDGWEHPQSGRSESGSINGGNRRFFTLSIIGQGQPIDYRYNIDDFGVPHKNTTENYMVPGAQETEVSFRNESSMTPRGEHFLILFNNNENIVSFAVIYQRSQKETGLYNYRWLK